MGIITTEALKVGDKVGISGSHDHYDSLGEVVGTNRYGHVTVRTPSGRDIVFDKNGHERETKGAHYARRRLIDHGSMAAWMEKKQAQKAKDERYRAFRDAAVEMTSACLNGAFHYVGTITDEKKAALKAMIDAL